MSYKLVPLLLLLALPALAGCGGSQQEQKQNMADVSASRANKAWKKAHPSPDPANALAAPPPNQTNVSGGD